MVDLTMSNSLFGKHMRFYEVGQVYLQCRLKAFEDFHSQSLCDKGPMTKFEVFKCPFELGDDMVDLRSLFFFPTRTTNGFFVNFSISCTL